MMSKKYYSVLDISILDILPQRFQIQILENYLNNKNGSSVFYTIESINSRDKQSIFKRKLTEKPKVDGFIFYSLIQFCYSKNINMKLINEILNSSYELIFYREEMHLKNNLDLKKNEKKIKLFYFNNKEIVYKFSNLI